ncbi:cytochrome P450 [Mycena olivaceomarginata]|nr:cytochrome P450 [Mycena olivaceomarginata]
MISQLLLPILGTLLAYVVYHVVQFLYNDLSSPLRGMAGPPSPSLLLGNFKQMADDALLTDKWRREFGPNFTFRGLFSVRELHTSDTKAISHIVARNVLYQKAPSSRYAIKHLFGSAEDHGDSFMLRTLPRNADSLALQNPAFGAAQIRQMTGVFVEKAIMVAPQLRDVWNTKVIPADDNDSTVEVLFWLRRMTLDVIGEAGFNHHFHNLDDKPSELSDAFAQLFHSPTSQRDNAFRAAQAMVPILRLVPLPGSRVFHQARTTMFSVGHELVEQSKLAAAKETADEPFSGRRDLLSLLVKANLSADIPEHQRLSDEEVIGRTHFPLPSRVAFTNISSAIAWALHSLSLNQEAQTKLREEVLAVSSDSPTMDELNSLVWLECVVRENMRLHAPVVFITRMAMQDDVLPLGKPYIDQNGRMHDSLPIRKGQVVHIPILAVNTDKETWGPDAEEFKPERWENVPKAANNVPGMWANLLTFFAGPHNCIGFRFSLVEQKALLFVLIRAFVFENAVPRGGIGRSSTVIQLPVVLGRNSGSQMPLIVKRYRG